MILVGNGEIPFRTVEDCAHGVRLCAIRTHTGLVIAEPMPHLEVQQLLLAAIFELKRRHNDVRCFLIIIEHDVRASRTYLSRQSNPKTPASDVQLMNPLIS